MKSEQKSTRPAESARAKRSGPFELRTDDVNRSKLDSARRSNASDNSHAKAANRATKKPKKSVSSQDRSDGKQSASDDTEFFDCASVGNRSIDAHKVTMISEK